MFVTLLLVIATLLTGYGIVQTKKQGNTFGFLFSSASFLILVFVTALAFML
jgi:hypothetical protein